MNVHVIIYIVDNGFSANINKTVEALLKEKVHEEKNLH